MHHCFGHHICDPSRKKGTYPNFTYGYFHSPGHEIIIVKNCWNVSEISLSHCEKFMATVKKVTVTVKIFHTVKKDRNV